MSKSELYTTISKHWPTLRSRIDARGAVVREASDALQRVFEQEGLVGPPADTSAERAAKAARKASKKVRP